MSDANAIPTITPVAPKKKEVSPELLERLARAREAAAAKRAATKLQKDKAVAFLKNPDAGNVQTSSSASSSPGEPSSSAPDKVAVVPTDSEGDTSESDSDTSDSDMSETNKRGKSRKVRRPRDTKQLKLLLEAEVTKAKEKYKNRYKNRYTRDLQALVAYDIPEKHQEERVSERPSNIGRVAANVAKADLNNALSKELVKSAMANLFGVYS